MDQSGIYGPKPVGPRNLGALGPIIKCENLADNIVRLKFSSIYNWFLILLNDIPLLKFSKWVGVQLMRRWITYEHFENSP